MLRKGFDSTQAISVVILSLSLGVGTFLALAQPAPDSADGIDRVLAYSRTSGFRHGSIEDGIKAMKATGESHNFAVDASESPEAFTADNLARYDVVVFLNTTQDVLGPEEEKVFEGWIRGGGGYVGIHAASDTEYDWPFYGKLMGAWFAGHPRVQSADINVVDRKHPATMHLPEKWTRTDEWYNFRAFPEGVRVLAYLDTDSYEGSSMKGNHPASWCHSVDQGRAFYTVGGHTKESFSEPDFLRHLLGAIWWAAGNDGAPPKAKETKPSSPSPKGETR